MRAMDDVRERLATLGKFFYMAAGAVGLLVPFPLAGILLGSGFLTAPLEGGAAPPPGGSMLVIVGSLAIALGLALGLGLALAGRFLLRARRYRFCIAMSWLACLLVPLGTLLGYYALVELHRPESRAAFAAPQSG